MRWKLLGYNYSKGVLLLCIFGFSDSALLPVNLTVLEMIFFSTSNLSTVCYKDK